MAIEGSTKGLQDTMMMDQPIDPQETSTLDKVINVTNANKCTMSNLLVKECLRRK
jgi:hypothetical protein